MSKTALLKIDDKEISCPVMMGTEGELAIDARNLRKDSGYIFYDQGYGNTGSCESAITFLDGDNGILRHRGYPIDQLAGRSEYVETAYLMIYGELPTQPQRTAFGQLLRENAAIETQMQTGGQAQVSLTDPDARSMKNRDGGIVGYNVQAAVDAEHHLIVAHEVVTDGVDRDQLAPMAEQARAATGLDALTVVADRGYFKSEPIRQCAEVGITPIVPKPLTSNAGAEGRFDKRDFIYIARDDEYRCPAGKRAIHRFTTVENGLTLHKYWSSACPRCPLKAQCTTGDYRRIARWEHEAVLEAMQARLDRQPELMRRRRCTVEHPFGTIKHWMGATHFLMRTLAHVRTEMSLHVLAYNLKRVMRILGIAPLLRALQA